MLKSFSIQLKFCVGWIFRAEHSEWKNTNFPFPRDQKKRKKKDIKIALCQQYCKSNYVNWYVRQLWNNFYKIFCSLRELEVFTFPSKTIQIILNYPAAIERKLVCYNHGHGILRYFDIFNKFSFPHKWNKAWLLVII